MRELEKRSTLLQMKRILACTFHEKWISLRMIIHHGLVVIWSDVVKFKKWFKNHSEHHCCTILFSNGIKIALNYKVTCNLQLFEDQKCFTTFATNRSSRFTMTLLLSTFIEHYSIIRLFSMQI